MRESQKQHHSLSQYWHGFIKQLGSAVHESEELLSSNIEEGMEASEGFKSWLDIELELAGYAMLRQCNNLADPAVLDWFEVTHPDFIEMASEEMDEALLAPEGNQLHCACCGYTINEPNDHHLPPCPKCQGTVFTR